MTSMMSLALFALGGAFTLLGIATVWRWRFMPGRRWALLLSIILTASAAISALTLADDGLLLTGLMGVIAVGSLGTLYQRDLAYIYGMRRSWLWPAVCGLWAIVFVTVTMTLPDLTVHRLTLVAGLAIAGGGLAAYALVRASRRHLPEVRLRALLWVGIIGGYLAGTGLVLRGSPLTIISGALLAQWWALAAALVIVQRYRIGLPDRRLPRSTTALHNDFSRQSATVTDAPDLASIAAELARTTVAADRAAWLPLKGDAKTTVPIMLADDSPLRRILEHEQTVIGRYDLLYLPSLGELSPTERAQLLRTPFDLFAPVIAERSLMGLLAIGRQRGNRAYTRHEARQLRLLAIRLGTLIDLRRAQSQLNLQRTEIAALTKQLKSLDKVKGDFIMIASHELRTPMAQIRGYADILAGQLESQHPVASQQVQPLLENLRKSITRTEDLLNAMLDVSQLETGIMDFNKVETSVDAVMRLVLDPLKPIAQQRDIILEAGPFVGLPLIRVDMQRIVQALRAIIANAIKFTPDGGRVEISAEVINDGLPRVNLRVADTGVGIAPEDLELIFEKLYRGFDTQHHSTGSYKFLGAGPGLGLTIARGIIKAHDGDIRAQSSGHSLEAKPGSTFTVELPTAPAPPVDPDFGETAEGESV